MHGPMIPALFSFKDTYFLILGVIYINVSVAWQVPGGTGRKEEEWLRSRVLLSRHYVERMPYLLAFVS